MDYVSELYSIYTIAITYDIRKTTLLTCISYVCNQCCCSKRYWYFGLIYGLELHSHILRTFLYFFSYNINTFSNKSVKIYENLVF